MRPHINQLVVLTAILVLGTYTETQAAGGVLDTTFNGTGKSVFNIESSAVGAGFAEVAVIGGNKVLIVGRAAIAGPSYYAVTLTRFNSDGSLDTSFGVGGKVMTDLGMTTEGRAVGVQSDGKIVVAADAGSSPNRMSAVLRYTADGVLDTTFGNNGVFFSSVMKLARDMSILPDDKILVAGDSDVPNFSITRVLKLNANGSLDAGFGNNGVTSSTYMFGSDTDKMAIQPDGKIVVSGANLFTVQKWLVHRFNTDGSPDLTFGTNGIRELILSGDMYPGGLGLQADGKIVMVGYAPVPQASDTQLLLTRLNADGSTDASFSGGSVYYNLTANYDRVYDMSIQSDGKLLIAGHQHGGQGMVARFDSAGAIDTTYGVGGVAAVNGSGNVEAIAIQGADLIAVGESHGTYIARLDQAGTTTLFRVESFVTGKNDQARAVAIQTDGKIVAAGASSGGSGHTVVSVARLLPNGTLDPSFGTDGRATISDGTNYSNAWAVAIQPDGKIVVAGRGTQATTFTYYSLFVARFNADGSPDASFGTAGKVIVTNPRNLIGHDMELQPDGKIVVGGRVERLVGDGIFEHDMMVARFNTNGTIDGGVFIYANGTAQSPSFEQAKAVTIQSDGKIILAGTHLLRLNSNLSVDNTFSPTPVWLGFVATDVEAQADGKVLVNGENGTDFIFSRYNSNASIDTGFGLNGTATLDFGGYDVGNAIYLDPNGDIVAGGSTLGGIPHRNRFAVARLKPNGSPDPTFGASGKVITDFGADAQIFGLARQIDGKIVAAGDAKISVDLDYALARYHSRVTPFDFDGDGKSDISNYRPSPGEWWILRSYDGGNRAAQFGGGTNDKITPADFTGDGKTDIAFCRNGGEWFVLREDNTYYSHPFGLAGDIAVPGDYDGDNIADEAVFRPSNGTWYVHKSGGGTIIEQFGTSGDIPVAADYDGDGKADLAIWRQSAGEWWIKQGTRGVIAMTFGNGADKPVQGDYTGDGRADVAFWRPSTGQWFILRSEDFSYYALPFGTAGDHPAPGDYDGDGVFDAAVLRPATATWYIRRSTAGILIQGFGHSQDRPVAGAFIP